MLEEFYKGKKCLVTGASGSIGKKIVKQLIKFDVELIKAFDNNETALFDLENEINSPKLKSFIGDVRDLRRLTNVLKDVDIVFHAAAYKHVPLCEYNPYDAVQTNVGGTQNVIDAAIECNVGKVILISTDKAANPVNVMGATKLLAERLIISSNLYDVNEGTVFSCVRFGNVLNSRGSVIPLFKNQIKKGGPITITDTEMTRFVMHMHEAAKLILSAANMAKGGEIFILKMPSINITDLAEAMVEYYGSDYGYKPEDIEMKIIGKRMGEKLYEELITPNENIYAYEMDELFIIKNNQYNEDYPTIIYNSKDAKKLTKEEIIKFLEELE
ncbi:MAG: polysaccharide biosynthesis protein [Methanobrevibacter sp.]|nr:polysaccharide biosynthesis protein [Methanobrevibacter sp.]